ncbi:PLP-dependent aminotransferase family protein [Marinospirillum alkaliphilum]|uniref:DNA-binding transcriptional regulator, MocR family, contains an aminotransferase domain n=1 Tax=Marinospirillum alkaliphilum DSM 21637 TaxID=1122209 RepID=A0A1K1UBR2_9GAMM|nr:PLP-dependent aminotransferase family protein [Marinospirillum alkaliphilum]SFX10028.1 DNA-binding transcriptional regulator, MocR family, contains an aminotransferase domain [Marinospirillum alkaliphilum DSM 21637]
MTITLRDKAQARCSWLPDLDAWRALHHPSSNRSAADNKTPRYKALADALAAAIQQGELQPDTRLPPQRLLADALEVTTGTVTRAYAEAERRGLVEARVGSGTYVRVVQADDRPDFYHLMAEGGDGSIDLSLSLMVPCPLRLQSLHQAMQQVAADPQQLAAALAYQSERGQPRQLQVFADWLQRLGVKVNPEQMIITDGGQHGIFLSLQALLAPGELLVSDALTYPGVIAAARELHLRHQGLPLDEEGLDTHALERLCQQQRPRAVYLMPDQNNPTGRVLSPARRQHLAELAERYDFWIIEDAVQFLPPEFRLQRLADLAPQRTLYLFSSSKILAGGLRVGLIAAPAGILPRLMAALRAHCWMAPPLMVALTCAWIESGETDRLLRWQWQEVQARQQLLGEVLAGQVYSRHPAGFVVWLSLPGDWRAGEFVRAAADAGVRVLAAEPFCVGNQAVPRAVRLCVSPPAERELLKEGLLRLKHLLESPPQGRAVF